MNEQEENLAILDLTETVGDICADFLRNGWLSKPEIIGALAIISHQVMMFGVQAQVVVHPVQHPTQTNIPPKHQMNNMDPYGFGNN